MNAKLLPLAFEGDEDPSALLLDEVLTERGWVANFYRMMANSPSTARPVFHLVWALWQNSPLGRRNVELIILRVSRLTGSDYEWVSHVPLARSAGVDDNQIDALRDGVDLDTTPAFDDRERLMLAVVDACVTGCHVEDALMARFAAVFDPAQRVDVMVVAGLYRLVATMLVSFDIPADERPPS